MKLTLQKIVLTCTVFFTCIGMSFGQNATVTGIVNDASEDYLIGANVVLINTSSGEIYGSVTDIDGNYAITSVPYGDYTLNISYIGYIDYNQTLSVQSPNMVMGNINLNEGGIDLTGVIVTGVMDIVQDRRTPVAVSTIIASEIQSKSSGNVELTEIAKSTPSVYVANQSGGYGDSEVFTRGFDQTNTAFLLNGQPINGMEDGKMYWSNWSGLTDVASAIQIQRGLGASKLAISSVGGTWNFIMKATDLKKGGGFGVQAGNDNYQKITAFYNTGMVNDKWGVSILLSNWTGNGWSNGARGQGQTYFISAGFKPSPKHTLNLLLTGAPQWHDQNFDKPLNSYFDSEGELNPKYNSNWGLYKGDYFTERRNFYHKPVFNLNWDFAINDVSSFSTVLYASLGRGGGTGSIGSGRIRTAAGLVDFDAIEAAKADDPDISYARRSSMNLHTWYGSVMTYERELSSELSFSIGGDLRSYTGDHFRNIANLISSDYYAQGGSTRYPNGISAATEYNPDPWSALGDFAPEGDRIAYNNAETIRYGGLFTQVEYSTDKVSAYVQGAVSNQSHVRFEKYYATEAEEESEKVTNGGYNLKGGLSYSLSNSSSVFVNSGVYSRQPFHDVVFIGNSNNVSHAAENEKIVGLELGYKFVGPKLGANINLYRTAWKNRIQSDFLSPDEEVTIGGVTYVSNGDALVNTKKDQLHTGVELDFSYRATDRLKIKGFSSVGNWKNDGDATQELIDDDRNVIATEELTGEGSVDGLKVGGSAQTSFGLGAKYKITNNFHSEFNYIHYADLYSKVADAELKLPAFGLADLNLGYTLPFSNGNVLKINANVYNLFDILYISQSRGTTEASSVESENWNGVNRENTVRFGKTRTWNIGMKYSF